MSTSELIEFIRSYREPVKIVEAAAELHHLGKLGADWPKASVQHWTRELEQLAKQGLLELRDGILSVPKPNGQLSLF